MKRPSLYERISHAPAGATALRHGSKTMSYGELVRQSGRLAAHLASLGVGSGMSIAICLERSFDAIVAALAAMASGAAYVPIDPALPDARIEFILEDSGACVLIAPPVLSGRVSTRAIPLDPDLVSIRLQEAPAPFHESAAASADLAYIVYTSGSTGVPKGVEITRGNLDHLIAWHLAAFEISASDRATHLAGLGFDAAVWEIWPCLAAGASITLAEDMTRIDPERLRQWIVDEAVTISFVPTPVAEPLLSLDWPEGTRLRFLLTGGDTLHVAPKPGLPFTLINNYGPTECTVVATSGPVMPGTHGLPSIGKAILGTSIYLLDEHGQRVTAGSPGEICIGGGSVGRGYRNLPEQTAKVFVDDPFSAVQGARMYKTGDRGILLRDGAIAFLGRNDGQEKIRGNRIELDEIVSVLARHPAVSFNTVVASIDHGDAKHLIAYVLPSTGATPSMKELQEFLAQSLPGYMIPARFVRLASLPLSINGKVDRDSLPLPSDGNALSEEPSREALSEVEEVLLGIVRNLLGTQRVGVDDDFFLVGGHSLLGTQLVLRAREAFGVMLSLRDLFEAGTVAELAAHIEALIMEEVDAMSEEEALRLATGEHA